MKLISFLKKVIKKITRWYLDPIPGAHIYRIDPVTIVVVIGFFTTAWGLGRAIGMHVGSYFLAESLREAAANMDNDITTLYHQDQISGYERQAALARIDMLAPIFEQYADIIEEKGNDIAAERYFQSALEMANTLNPAEKAGKLVGLLAYGKGLDQILSIGWSANTIGEFELLPRPFSEEEAALRKRLDEEFEKIANLSIDELFKARMRVKINYIRNDWIYEVNKNPCQGEMQMDALKDRYRAKAKDWAEHPVNLVGDGEKWTNTEEFLDWLILQMLEDREENISKTWFGNFEMDTGPTASCKACIPPWMSGTIELHVNLETCAITGEINGSGEGPAITSACEGGVANPCSGSGSISFSGDVSGSADATGILSLDPTKVTTNATVTWGSGCSLAPGEYSDNWVDELTISGTIDWEGLIQGEVNYPLGDGCGSVGEYTLILGAEEE